MAGIAAGGNNTCAVTTTGRVRCWGDNSAGQLGRGDTFTESTMTKPITVLTIGGGATAVAVGAGHVCAIVDQRVACWGSGVTGQLGTGGAAPSAVPLIVERLPTGATAIAAGKQTTCAVSAGNLYCWGDNTAWQGGSEVSQTLPIPTTAAGLPAVSAVAVGLEGHACAALASGGAQCWGNNAQYRLGRAGVSMSGSGVTVKNLTGQVTAVAAGMYHTCAIASGALQCWGGNSLGELGDPSIGQHSDGAIKVLDHGSGVTSVCAGFMFTCALREGAVRCFGNNSSGQLGNGTKQNSMAVSVALRGPAKAVACGQTHACAWLEDGRIQCWGEGASGQLGNRTNASSPLPVDVAWP